MSKKENTKLGWATVYHSCAFIAVVLMAIHQYVMHFHVSDIIYNSDEPTKIAVVDITKFALDWSDEDPAYAEKVLYKTSAAYVESGYIVLYSDAVIQSPEHLVIQIPKPNEIANPK